MNALPSAGLANTRRMPHAQLMLGLLQAALVVPDVPSAVLPALQALVARTAATGAGYAQVVGPNFYLRAISGDLPRVQGAGIALETGLPVAAPLIQTLAGASTPQFIADTQCLEETKILSQLGIAALAAAPFTSLNGKLLGAFLMYTPKCHRWRARERELFAAFAELLGTLVARLLAEEDAIRALGMAVEGRDPKVAGHLERVTWLAERVGRGLGLDEATLGAIRLGAYLHDLGKLDTPDAILHKPDQLDADEREVMQQHAEAGHHVAQQLAFLPQAALDTILYHHERWDGRGYPEVSKETTSRSRRGFSPCATFTTPSLQSGPIINQPGRTSRRSPRYGRKPASSSTRRWSKCS